MSSLSAVEITIFLVYGTLTLMLVLFGLHKYFLLHLYLKYRNKPIYRFREQTGWPVVTIQLPIFNEKYVVKRLIYAVCAIDYPKELLEIQVLDDSTDETSQRANNLVNQFHLEGFDIKYVHRVNREGFKAGALEYGMRHARGEFLAVFDADFIPTSDFLKKTLPYFQYPEVGVVQARWGHVNRDYSLLTRIQALFLDGHFVIEHTARNRSGRFFNFNGTAGVWRKQAIVQAGGWQHDTLTEDLDLSYRAQLAGWKFVYLPDVVVPAELPVEMNSYKAQQHRWAKGSVQTAKKLLPAIWRSNIPFFVKLEASAHLFSNFNYLFMTIPSLLMPLVLSVQYERGWDWMLYIYMFVFLSATLSVCVYYYVSQRHSNPDWKREIRFLPALMSVGIGLSINNAKAVLEAIFNHTTEFKRTPKYRIENVLDSWHKKKYQPEFNLQPLFEIAMGGYFIVSFLGLLGKGVFISIPFFLLFQFGFVYIGSMSLIQSSLISVSLGQVKLFFQNTLSISRKPS